MGTTVVCQLSWRVQHQVQIYHASYITSNIMLWPMVMLIAALRRQVAQDPELE